MESIIRGTTPTIEVTFPTVDVSSITAAFLTVRSGPPPERDAEPIISKNLSAGTKGEKSITWTLTQTDTLALVPGLRVTVCCDWKTQDGTRGRSQEAVYLVEETGIDGVI